MFPISVARGVSPVAASFLFAAGLAFAQQPVQPVPPLPPPSQPALAPQPGAPFTITGQSVAPAPSSP